MKIFEGHDTDGQLVYFEVPNTLLSRKAAVKIIKEIPNVEILKNYKRDDIFCTFKLGNRVFEIMEPFGDNSRYYIGEPIAQSSEELKMIKEKFSTINVEYFHFWADNLSLHKDNKGLAALATCEFCVKCKY